MRSRSSRIGARLGLVLAALVSTTLVTRGVTLAQNTPGADEIIAKMKAVLEPNKPSTRVMTLTAQGAEANKFTLIQARKDFPDGARSLTFVIDPSDARGVGYLVQQKSGNNAEYIYVPMVRRVRELVPAENYTTFLNTDFTYGDLGFLPVDDKNKLLGTETFQGKKAYKVESTPSSSVRQWYYSRYVTWIDAETLLPLQRQFFSPANSLFKVETFEDVSVVDGVPTPFRITMRDLPSKTSSELAVTSVSYGNTIPDDFFTPGKLPELEKEGNAAEKAAKSKAASR